MHSFSGYRQPTRRVEACFELDVAEKGSGSRRSRVGAGPTGDRLRICLFADGNGRKGETAENKGESNHDPRPRPDTNKHVTSLALQYAKRGGTPRAKAFCRGRGSAEGAPCRS